MCVKQVYKLITQVRYTYINTLINAKKLIINIINYMYNIIHKIILICSVECIPFMSNPLTAKSDEALAQIT